MGILMYGPPECGRHRCRDDETTPFRFTYFAVARPVFRAGTPESSRVIDPCPPRAALIVIARSRRVREGKDAESLSRPHAAIVSVSVYLTAERTPVGGKSRGEFTSVLVPATPVGYSIEMPNVTFVRHAFQVPFYDAVRLRLFAKGFDAAGVEAARAKMPVTFVPASVPADMASGVVVSKSRQRMFALKDGAVKAAWVVNGPASSKTAEPDSQQWLRFKQDARPAPLKPLRGDCATWNAITTEALGSRTA